MDDELDRLVGEGARPVPTPAMARDIADGVWTRLQREVAAGSDANASEDLQRRRLGIIGERELSSRRRRSARVASITLAVVVAGAGTAAAADYLATRTGEVTTGWEQDAAGRGELLNPAGTDRAEVFDQVTVDIVFPPGYETSRQYVLDFYPAEADSRVTEGTLRSHVARGAVCSWADAWVAADDAGNRPARDEATAVLAAAANWPDIQVADFPDATIYPDGSTRSYNGWVPPLAQAADDGDRAALLDVIAGSNACQPETVPVMDTSPDYPLAGVR